jgi:putative glutamine amidotransferase
MKPVIGVTSSYDWDRDNYILPASYIESIIVCGGLPILLPPTTTMDSEESIALLDGIMLTGGVDVDPSLYGEPPMPALGKIDPLRDGYELYLTREAIEHKKPLLAICRGIQVLNVALGGTLYQDLYTQVDGSLKHSQMAPRYYPTHKVKILKGSELFEIFGKNEIGVNSFHHQGIKTLGKGLNANAWSEDGLIEGVENQDENFVLGVQWHPERMIKGEMVKIFQAFVEKC